jgi:23S rRNA-/tRNA-specific pseudouridylate synthase
VFLGLVHRLDRQASGVVVLARTSKAAARLSEEIRSHRPRKSYWALVEGEAPADGQWIDRLARNEFTSQVVKAPAGKEARLSFRRLHYEQDTSLVEISLETGRHHQIRVQFAYHGLPLLGDRRYGSKKDFLPDAIALHARQMLIRHPTLREEMAFTVEPVAAWQQYLATMMLCDKPTWQVSRLDDNGNRFIVASKLSANQADILIRDYQQQDNKQTYFKEMENA